MIFINYFFVILWACVCQISAPISPPTRQEFVDDQAIFAGENVPRDPQRLHIYLQIIKNIDIEQSMESIVELMNMLRLMFPIRFFRIKRKLMDLYDPITQRSFGIAFHALMNMLRDKSKRDRLYTIFQELIVPHSSDKPQCDDDTDRNTSVQQSGVKLDLPLKYKPAPVYQDTNIAKAAKPTFTLENPLPTENTQDVRFQAVTGTSGPEPGYETDFVQPSEIPRKPGRLNPVLVNESDQPSIHVPQTNVLPQETSAVNSRVENFEAKRRETELRLARMKSFLDKVQNNSAAPATLQAKAAMISRILAKEGVTVSSQSDNRLPRAAS